MTIDVTSSERLILQVLYAAHKALPTERIAYETDLSWATTKKYLLGLQRKGMVYGRKYGKAMYWWLRV